MTELQRDRAQQLRLLPALDVSAAHLRRDDCGWWIIAGRHGAIHTWGDDQTWVAYIRCRSAKHWTATKRRLSFMKVTQDGDNEGCLRLFALPTPDQAALIREVLGLKKRRQYDHETLERLRATAGSLFRGQEQAGRIEAASIVPEADDAPPVAGNSLAAIGQLPTVEEVA